MSTTQAQGNTTQVEIQTNARFGLAIVRLTIGAMFVLVFFENLEKGLYKPDSYADLINGYIQHGHAPGAWKSVMAFMAVHASLTAPVQGYWVVAGARTVYAFGRARRFRLPRQPMDFGVGHVMDLGTTRAHSSGVGAGGQTCRPRLGP